MSAKKTVLGALNVRAGEAQRVFWLVAHSLFIGLFAAFFLTSANALFLERFDLSLLPIAYIATGGVGYLFLMLFSRLQKAVSLKWTLLLNAAFLLLLVGTLWLLVLTTQSAAVVFFMFVCVGPAFSLLALGYWALAGRLFDLRQGKRLFGLVGAGEEVSTVVCLFAVPLIVRRLGGPLHLLPIALVGLVGCLLIVVATSLRFQAALDASPQQERRPEAGETRSGLTRLLRNHYFLLLASLIVFLNLGHYMVDFGFLSQVRGRFEGSTVLAQFIALFYGVTKVLELLAKVFLSGRLLNQFGLKFGLLAMPVLLLACSGFAIAIGMLGLPAAHFFVLVVLSKLVWLVSRTSTFEPSFRVLYQPVGAEKLAFQTHAEGTARHLATGVVGVGLVLFSRNPAFNALTLFYALVPLLVAWSVVAVLAHRDYRGKLIDSLSTRLRGEGERKPLDVLKPLLHAEEPLEREQAFDLLEKVEGAALAPALAEMLADPSPALRVAALQYVGRARLVDIEEWVSGCLSDPEPTVQRAARDTLDCLREAQAAGASADRVALLADSGDPAERVLAAEAIGRTGEQANRLWVLLFDAEWTARRAALTAAARLARPEFWQTLIGELESPVLSGTAATSLVSLGERVLPDLERAFHKADQAPRVRRRILEIYEAIGGAKAQALLAAKLAFPYESVRTQALVALSRAGYQADAASAPTVTRAIEALVEQMAWNMSAVLDLGDDSRVVPVVRTLEEEIEAGRARLFQLLSLIYDPWAIGLVRENIASGTSETTAYALEILDLLLADELKPLVLPLFEGLTYSQALRRMEGAFPRHRLDRVERLSMIVNRDYDKIGSWTRACALAAVGELGATASVPDLVASLYHPDPLMHELAAFTMMRLDAQTYARHHARLGYEARERLAYVLGPDGTMAHWDSRSVFGRAQLLRGLDVFALLPSLALVRLARASEELVLNPRRRLPSPRAPQESFYVNVDGEQAFLDGSGAPRLLPARRLIAFGPRARSIEVVTTSRFIRIDPDQVFELATEYVDLIPALLRARKQIMETLEEETHRPEPSLVSPALPMA